MPDQIKRFACRRVQSQRVPAHPHDEVGCSAAPLQEPSQNRRAGVIAVTDPDFARQRGATCKRLSAILVGQFEVREPVAPEIEHTVDAPVGALAAGFADAGAISKTETTAGPTQIGTLCFRRQQSFGQGREKIRSLVRPVFDAGNCSVRRSPTSTPRPRFGATTSRPARVPTRSSTGSRRRQLHVCAGSPWSPARDDQSRDRPEVASTGPRTGPSGQMPRFASVLSVKPIRAGSSVILARMEAAPPSQGLTCQYFSKNFR
jgi:hypothetical protein